MKMLFNRKTVVAIMVLILVTTIISDIYADEELYSRRKSEQITSDACFDWSDRWSIVEWTLLADSMPSQSDELRKVIELYEQGRKEEQQSMYANACGFYHGACASMKMTAPGLSFPPAEKKLFTLQAANLYPINTFSVLSLSRTYDGLGRGLVCENLAKRFKLLRNSIREGQKDSQLAIEVALCNIELMRTLVTQEKALVFSNNGFAIVGWEMLRFWAESLLDSGIQFTNGRWEKFDPAKVLDLKKETRGILKGNAFSLNSSSFVIGLAEICRRANIRYPRMRWDDLWENSWEYCLVSHEMYDPHMQAMVLFEKGRVLEQMGAEEQAIAAYFESAKVTAAFGGGYYWDPMIALSRESGLADPTEKKMVEEILKWLDMITTIQTELSEIRSSIDADKADNMEASLFHCAFVRDMVLGRILSTPPPSQKKEMGIKDSSSLLRIVDRNFITNWITGMQNYGVLLSSKTFLQLTAFQTKPNMNRLHPLQGFWKGCFINKDGDIFVAGVKYFKVSN